MTHATRRLEAVIPVSIALALAVAACTGSAGSTAPSAVGTGSPAPTASSGAPSPSPSSSAAVVSTADPTTCTISQDINAPTDRLTNVTVTPGATSDRLDFVFGDSSLPGPASPPDASLQITQPPFTRSGSGAPVDMGSDRVVQLIFTGMSLQNDAGEEMFTGPTELTPNLPGLHKAVQFDASEGTIGWYIGFDKGSCVVLGRDTHAVTVTIDHP